MTYFEKNSVLGTLGARAHTSAIWFNDDNVYHLSSDRETKLPIITLELCSARHDLYT